MTIESRTPHLVIVVRAPSSELDLDSSAALRTALRAAHAPQATIVLDLAAVTFIDSSALAVVLAAERRLVDCGGRLLVAHPSGRVHRVLRLCGLDRLLMTAGENERNPRLPSPQRFSRPRRSRSREAQSLSAAARAVPRPGR